MPDADATIDVPGVDPAPPVSTDPDTTPPDPVTPPTPPTPPVSTDPSPTPPAGDPPAGDPPPTPTPGFGDQANLTPEEKAFLETIPDEYKSEAMFGSVKSLKQLFDGYYNAQKSIGTKGIFPGSNATKEEWDAFHTKAGRPPTADEYNLPAPGENSFFKADEEFSKQFKAEAHAAGLSAKQVEHMYRWYSNAEHEKISSELGALEKNKETAVARLRGKWGPAYEQNNALGMNAARLLSEQIWPNEPDRFSKYLAETGKGNDLDLNEMFAAIGKMFAEDDVSGSSNVSFKLSPDEAKEKIELIQGEHFKAIKDPTHPKYKALNAELQRLYPIAHGTEQVIL